MTQTGHFDQLNVTRGDAELRLGVTQVRQHQLGQMRDAHAVLEAVVGGAGEHQVGAAELLEIAQTLEFGCIQKTQKQWSQGDLAERCDGEKGGREERGEK